MLARRHWFTLASALISVVTVYLLYRWLNDQGPIRLPSGREAVLYTAGAVAVYLSSFLVRGLRWRVLLSEVGVRPPLRETTGLLTVGYAANTLIPARAGDAVRVFLMAQRTGAGASLMVSTLIAERLLDVAVLGSAFVITSLIYSGGLPTGNRAMIALAGAAVLLIGLLVLRWMVKRDHLPSGVRGILRDASLAVRQLRGSRHLAQVAGLTIAAWALETLVYLMAAHAAGVQLNAGQAVYVLATAAIFTMIPSGPGFAGTMDGAIVYTLHQLGEPRNLVWPFIFVIRFVIFIPITIIGGVLLAVRYGGWSAIKAARSAQQQENAQAEEAARRHEPLPDPPTGEMAALPADAGDR